MKTNGGIMKKTFGFSVRKTEDCNIQIVQEYMGEEVSIHISPLEFPLLVEMINDEIGEESLKYECK